MACLKSDPAPIEMPAIMKNPTAKKPAMITNGMMKHGLIYFPDMKPRIEITITKTPSAKVPMPNPDASTSNFAKF